MKTQIDYEQLRLLSNKIRSIGHLIETQDPNHAFPDDYDHVQYGLALILNEIAMDILKMYREFDASLIKK